MDGIAGAPAFEEQTKKGILPGITETRLVGKSKWDGLVKV
jgi:hypothetical protein